MTKILFVCSANIDRSPTAECLYANHPDLKVKSAGTAWYARVQVSAGLLLWADVILCMEERHQQYIVEDYPDAIAGKVIAYLDIPDIYHYNDPVLKELIKEKADVWLLKYKQNKKTGLFNFLWCKRPEKLTIFL